MMDNSTEEIDKLKKEVGDALELINDAISHLKNAKRIANRVGGEIDRVVGGQIQYYTIGDTRSFIEEDNHNQPGNIPYLLKFIDEYVNGENNKEK